MMRRRTILLTLILFNFLSVVFADAYESISTALVPFNAGNNVDMASKEFPDRNGNIEFVKNSDPTALGTYNDDQIVAGGGIYGIPKEGSTLKDGNKIYYPSGISPLNVSVQCSSDFNYVSQSHSEFIRPFKLFVVGRYAASSSPDTVTGGHAGNTTEGLGDDGIIEAQVRFGDSYTTTQAIEYMNMWFDMVLALPQDSITDNGVIIENTVYPLISATDYTATVTISISWDQDYRLSNGTTGRFNYSKSMTLPFSGYFDASKTGDDNVNVSIIRLPGASNINLNPGFTGTGNQTAVADLNVIVNFADGLVTSESQKGDVKIFLSSSVDPLYPGSEFKLIHEDYSEADEYNSFRYWVNVRSTEGNVQSVVFDGTDHLVGDVVSDTWLTTDCHNDEYFMQSSRLMHFHSFNGTVFVEVSDENDQKTMMAGRYFSRIYVHVVVD